MKKGGSGFESIEEAIDFVNNQLSVDDLSTASVQTSTTANLAHSSLASQDQPSSCATNVGTNNHAPGTHLDLISDQNEAQIPSELITQCVATLLMIQVSIRYVCMF